MHTRLDAESLQAWRTHSLQQDEMLPPAHMAELYAVHPSPPWRWIEFQGGRHMDAYDSHAAQVGAAAQSL